MRIEIFVVATRIQKLRGNKTINRAVSSILSCKQDLTKLFGGLTELPYFKGLCMNKGKIEVDTGELWIIYTNKPELSEDIRFKSILLELKATTKQREQMYAINNEMYLI